MNARQPASVLRAPGWAAAALAAFGLTSACHDPVIPERGFARCPNKVCEPSESSATCPSDCPACTLAGCDDKNPCTIDTCDPKVGCSHTPSEPLPCDASPCFESGLCTDGKCVGTPRLWTWSHDYANGKKDTATAVVRDIDGGLLVAVESWNDTIAFGKQRDSYALRIPASGWFSAAPPAKVALATDEKYDDAIGAMAALAGGGALVVGSKAQLLPVNGQPPRKRARYAVVQGAGSAESAENYLDIDGDHWFSAVGRASDDTLLAVGGLDQQGLATRFFPSGKPSWNLVVPSPGSAGRLYAVTGVTASAKKSAAWVAVGDTGVGGQLQGWAVGLAHDTTKVVWSVAVPQADGCHGTLAVVAPDGQGGVLAGGVACSAAFGDQPKWSGARTWWVRISAGGIPGQQHLGEQDRLPVALLSVPAGGWIAATMLQPATAVGVGSLLILDAEAREHAASPVVLPYLAGAALLPDGTLALAGQLAVHGQGDAWMARVDRWGNPSCEKSGDCLGKPLIDCADGNACTADGCQGTQCSHAANPVGAGCGGNGQCKGTICKIP